MINLLKRQRDIISVKNIKYIFGKKESEREKEIGFFLCI